MACATSERHSPRHLSTRRVPPSVPSARLDRRESLGTRSGERSEPERGREADARGMRSADPSGARVQHRSRLGRLEVRWWPWWNERARPARVYLVPEPALSERGTSEDIRLRNRERAEGFRAVCTCGPASGERTEGFLSVCGPSLHISYERAEGFLVCLLHRYHDYLESAEGVQTVCGRGTTRPRPRITNRTPAHSAESRVPSTYSRSGAGRPSS